MFSLQFYEEKKNTFHFQETLLRWVLGLHCIELSDLDSQMSSFTQTPLHCFFGPTGLIRRSSQTKQLHWGFKTNKCASTNRLFHYIILIDLNRTLIQLHTRRFLGIALIDPELCCMHPQLGRLFWLAAHFVWWFTKNIQIHVAHNSVGFSFCRMVWIIYRGEGAKCVF